MSSLPKTAVASVALLGRITVRTVSELPTVAE